MGTIEIKTFKPYPGGDRGYAIHSFTILHEEVFRRAANRSALLAKRGGVTDPNMVISEDNMDFFVDYLDTAFSDLMMEMARFQRSEEVENPKDHKIYDPHGHPVEFLPWIRDVNTGDWVISIILQPYQDRNVLPALPIRCIDFLVNKALELFYGTDTGAAQSMQRITDILNYQRKRIRIKTSPF